MTSVSWTGDGTIFTASADTPVTTSGTLTPASLIAQVKNTFLAGPTTGSNAAPTFRAIGASDVPNQLTIGNAVSGGGTNRILYEDGSSNLAASANATFSGSNLAIASTGQLQLGTDGFIYQPAIRQIEFGTTSTTGILETFWCYNNVNSA